MSDKIVMVTEPDEIWTDGFRILLFDLDPDQYAIFSRCVLEHDMPGSLIVYNAYASTNIKWIVDKMFKSDMIIFNASSTHQKLAGYLAAKPGSCYFGELGDLFLVNSSVVFDAHQLHDLLERRFEKYGKF